MTLYDVVFSKKSDVVLVSSDLVIIGASRSCLGIIDVTVCLAFSSADIVIHNSCFFCLRNRARHLVNKTVLWFHTIGVC